MSLKSVAYFFLIAHPKGNLIKFIGRTDAEVEIQILLAT